MFGSTLNTRLLWIVIYLFIYNHYSKPSIIQNQLEHQVRSLLQKTVNNFAKISVLDTQLESE